MINASNIVKARQRIAPYILNTPLVHSKWLSDACNGKVYLKLESQQYTGSFKARGSLNKLLWLKEQKDTSFPITASSGNHGLGFARSLDLLKMKGKIFLPENAVSSKVEAILKYDAEIEFQGASTFDTEIYAKQKAVEKGWLYVSPYNDEQIIAGQGTIAPEVLEKVENPDNILATVGGGGLISGIAAFTDEKSPKTKIIGCQPEHSPEMALSVQSNEYREVESKPTLSDGSAGGFEKDSITFPLCKKWVDEFILVSEDEIKQAVYDMIKHHSKLIEGAAGAAVAALLKNAERFAGKTTVVIVCGANISPEKLREVLYQ